MLKIGSVRVPALHRGVLLAAMLAVALGAASCTGAAPQRGWSGGTLVGDTIYFGSRDGRIIGVNISEGSREWAAPLETGTVSTGLGCSRAPVVVSIYGTPIVSGGLLYVGGYNGKVYSLVPGDSQPDRVLRTVRVGERDVAIGPIVGSIVGSGDEFFFASGDGNVYGVNARLQPTWSEPFKTGGKIWSSPAVDADTVYVGSYDKKVYAINAADGSLRWAYPAEGAASQGAFVATPVVHEGTVYAGSFDRHLYAIDASSGRLKWTFKARHAFWASPVIVNGLIFAPSLDGTVYILRDGGDAAEEVEGVKLGSPVSSSPVAVGGLVVFATEAGVIWTIDTTSYQARELASLGERVYADLAANETSVFVHTDRDSLFGVDAANGTLRPYVFK